ncbi:MAG: hypothetical protein U0736_23005 [Gemmataceae bacterium]
MDALDVLWPDGTRETFPGGKANRVVTLRKGDGKRVSPGVSTKPTTSSGRE